MITNEDRRAARAILRDKGFKLPIGIAEDQNELGAYEAWDNGEGWTSVQVSIRPCVARGVKYYYIHVDRQSNDCDGPTTSHTVEEAKVSFTRSTKKTGPVLIPHVEIRQLHRRQRDYYAEAMGY